MDEAAAQSGESTKMCVPSPQNCVESGAKTRRCKGLAGSADINTSQMNPLELQVLSIVCGVATDQRPPAPEVNVLAVVASPTQKVATASRDQRGVWPTFVSRDVRVPNR